MSSPSIVVAVLFALAMVTATVDGVTALADAPCGAGTVRLVSYHYVVDGIRHDRLEGKVGTGDLFTLVVNLQACGATPRGFAMDFEVPPCAVPYGDERLAWVEDLNSANVTDDAEAAMVQDLRAVLSCDPVLPQGFASAAIISVTLGAIGTLVAMFAIRRRRR